MSAKNQNRIKVNCFCCVQSGSGSIDRASLHQEEDKESINSTGHFSFCYYLFIQPFKGFFGDDMYEKNGLMLFLMAFHLSNLLKRKTK